MFRKPISSSDIRSVGYANNILEIEFLGGGIYQYAKVPEFIYQNLMSASSHGKYFHAYIKNKYPTNKLS